MEEQQKSALNRAVIVVMSLPADDEARLDAANQAALKDAMDVCAQFSGRAVARAFRAWSRSCIRHMPARTVNVVPDADALRPRFPHLNLGA